MTIVPRRPLTLVAVALLLSAIALFAWWFWPRQDTLSSTEDPDAVAESGGPRVRVSAIGKPEAAQPTGFAFQRALGSISGTVTEPGGKPLPGASVCAWLGHRDAPAAITRTPRCTISGPDGHYRLADLPPIDVALEASAEQHLPAKWHETGRNPAIHLQPGQDRSGIDLVLAPGGVLVQGIVRDIAGGVVEGAFVTATSGGGTRLRRTGSTRSVTTTDAEGRFTTWVADGEVVVTAVAEGYGRAIHSGVAPGLTFELFMTPESILVGRVVQAGTNTPVSNAIVRVQGQLGPWRMVDSDVITDAEGRFRIDGLDPGTYHPTVENDDGYGRAPRPVHVGLAQTSDEIVIELHPIATVAGVVVADGKPCTDGHVTLLLKGPGLGAERQSNTEPDGSVLLRSVRPGTYTVGASCEGFVSRDDFDPLVVERTPIEGLRWELARGVSITGTVVDEKGAAVERADVWASSVSTEPKSRTRSGAGETDASGTFAITGLEAGKYALNARADGFLRMTDPVEIEIGEHGTDAARIVLTRGGAIEGDVVDTNGEPVAGASVDVSGSQSSIAGTARDDGTFRIEGVEPGNHRVTASRGWFDDLRAPGETDDAVKGVPARVVANAVAKVHLVVDAHDGRIAGRVIDARGTPVSDAFVDSARESDSAAAAAGRSVALTRWGAWGREPVLTDENGNFEIRELARGRYTLRAYRKGGGEAIAEHVEVGSTGVVLGLAETGSIAGRVELAGGGAPEWFRLTARDRSKGYSQGAEFYATHGVFELTELPAGAFELSVTSREGDGNTNVALASGEALTGVTVELAGKVDVRGRVIDLESGEPVPGLRVTIGIGGNPMLELRDDDDESVSDASGRFFVRQAQSGRVRMSIRPRAWNDVNAYGVTTMSAEIPPGVGEHDLGDVQVFKSRLEPGARVGDLGLKLEDIPPGARFEEFPLTVAVVRPGGPAVAAGLEVGDVIETVDGHDVKGPHRHRYQKLVNAPVGTKLAFGLAGGRRVEIILGAAP